MKGEHGKGCEMDKSTARYYIEQDGWIYQEVVLLLLGIDPRYVTEDICLKHEKLIRRAENDIEIARGLGLLTRKTAVVDDPAKTEYSIYPSREVIAWAKTKPTTYPNFPFLTPIVQDEPIAVVDPAATPEPKSTESTATPDWKKEARRIADELFDKDTHCGCRDSLAGYSKRVMDEMQVRGIHGSRGRIDNPNTVKREALQEALWRAEKQK
jgi:hypothetical protein